MKKIFLLLLFFVSSSSYSSEFVWQSYYKILKENNGYDENDQIRFDFPWKSDKKLLLQLDELTQYFLKLNQIEKNIEIVTTATDRIKIEIYKVVENHQDLSYSGFIIKKHWKGVFGYEFSYKIVPMSYLNLPRSLGKIDKYDLGFIQATDPKIIKLLFPTSMGSTVFKEYIIPENDMSDKKVLTLNLIIKNSKLINITDNK